MIREKTRQRLHLQYASEASLKCQLKLEVSAREASEEDVERLLAVEVAIGVLLQAEATRASARETEPLDERVPGLSDNLLTRLQVASRQNFPRNSSMSTEFSSFTL
jgi:hypothetical protein